MADSVLLKDLEEWPEEFARKLEASWITTAEQVVATSASPMGLASLAEQLGVSKDEMRRLVSAARSHLSPEIAREMETPVDVRNYGLGALKPRADKEES